MSDGFPLVGRDGSGEDPIDYGMNTPADVHETLMNIAKILGYGDVTAADFDVVNVIYDGVWLLKRDLDEATSGGVLDA